jgi:hypothetical protein
MHIEMPAEIRVVFKVKAIEKPANENMIRA